MANVSKTKKSTATLKVETLEATNKKLDAQRLIALIDEQYQEIQQDALKEILRCAAMDLPAIQAKLKACQSFKEKMVSIVNAGSIAEKKLENAIKGGN